MKSAVLTVSDRAARGERPDGAGPLLAERLRALGHEVTLPPPVSDDRDAIAERLRELAHGHTLVLTTGGTGLGPRDVTPEATLDVAERVAPGFVEEIRRRGAADFPGAILSRAVCVVRGRCLILNLPGSPKGAVESFSFVEGVLLHALRVIAGGVRDCKDDPASGRAATDVPETGKETA